MKLLKTLGKWVAIGLCILVFRAFFGDDIEGLSAKELVIIGFLIIGIMLSRITNEVEVLKNRLFPGEDDGEC